MRSPNHRLTLFASLRLLGLVLTLAISIENARGDVVLYNLAGTNFGDSIYTVNPSVGSTTQMGNFGGISPPDLTGLARREGDEQYIYSIDSSGFRPQLSRIDVTQLTPGSGLAVRENIGSQFSTTTLGVSSSNLTIDSLAISSLDSNVAVISGYSGAGFDRFIFRAQVSDGTILGSAVPMAHVSLDTAMVYSLDGTTLYGSFGHSLYTINSTTGATSLIGNMGVSLTGLAFNPQDGLLYGTKSSGGSELYTVNTSSGALTSVAAWPTYGISSEGIAFVGTAVPEPSSIVLPATCLLGMWFRRRNRS